jgi:hypothetical protein
VSPTLWIGSLLVVHFALMLLVPFVFVWRSWRRPGIQRLVIVAILFSWVFQSVWVFALILPAFLADVVRPDVLLGFAYVWTVLGALVCYPLLAGFLLRMGRSLDRAR